MRNDPVDRDALLLSRGQDGELSHEESAALKARLDTEAELREVRGELEDVRGALRFYFESQQSDQTSLVSAESRRKMFQDKVAHARIESGTWSLFKGVLATASVAILMVVTWTALRWEGGQEALAEFAVRIRSVARSSQFRQYKVTFNREVVTGDDSRWGGRYSSRGPTEGTLYTLGGDRFALIQDFPSHDGGDSRMYLGGQGQRRWFHFSRMPVLMEAQTPEELPKYLANSDFYYMDLDEIIDRLGDDYRVEEKELADESLKGLNLDATRMDIKGRMRHLTFSALKEGVRMREIEILADEAAEVHRMILRIKPPFPVSFTIQLERQKADADPTTVFEPESHCPAGLPRVGAREFFEQRLKSHRNFSGHDWRRGRHLHGGDGHSNR